MRQVDLTALPLLIRVDTAVAISGFSRSEVYNRLNEGSLRGKKMRSRTLVETASLIENVQRLPNYGSA